MSGGLNPGNVKSDQVSDGTTRSPESVFDAWSFPTGVVPERFENHPVDALSGTGPTLRSPILSEAASEALLEDLRAGPRVTLAERIRAMGEVCERFLPTVSGEEDPLRTEAVRLLAPHACLSRPAAGEVLTRMASDWTRARLGQLVEREFPGWSGTGDPVAADDLGFGASTLDPDGRPTRLRPIPPPLVLTICSGTVPGVSVTATLRALLTGSAVLLKPGAGDAVLPVLFARALREASPEIAGRVAVAYWPGGTGVLESRALQVADRIVVYGGADTIREVRRRAGPRARLTEYRHRMGLAVVHAGGEGNRDPDRLADLIVEAVVPYEQRGCVSPVRVLAVGDDDAVERLSGSVGRSLERRSNSMPGSRTPDEAAELHQLEGTLELRKAAGQDVEIRSGTDWMVVRDEDREPGPGGRMVRITPIASMGALAEEFRRYRDQAWGTIQSVGVAGFALVDERRVASMAADAGASRVAPLNDVAYPPPWWMHEGSGPLRALVDWTEWVGEAE